MKKKSIFIQVFIVILLFLVYTPILNNDTSVIKTMSLSDFGYREYKDIKNVDVSVLVNKSRRLSEDYVPNDLISIDSKCSNNKQLMRKNAAKNLNNMCFEMLLMDTKLSVISSYRSYEKQKDLFTYFVKKEGVERAIISSAMPGHSEHQTGLAADITFYNYKHSDIHTTNAYIWIKNNMHRFGFIERYPKEKKEITGYIYEPWHIRYVGKKIASYIYEHNITFDEYYKIFIEN